MQMKRLMRRNQLTYEEANLKIAAQMDIKDKIKKSQILIDNSSSEEGLKTLVKAHIID